MGVQSANKPGVGQVLLHTRWWRPNKVVKVRFRPEGREVTYVVPVDDVPDLLATKTLEEAMALVRRPVQH